MKIPGCRRCQQACAHGAVYSIALAFAGGSLSTASAAEVTGYARGGGTFQPYEITGVPLLDSFYFRYTGGERHVQAIAVEPASPIPNPNPQDPDAPAGEIFLTLQDYGRDDEYFYSVSHAAVPEGVFRHRTFASCRKTCSEWLNPPSRDSVFVITGFSFTFPGTDHHLKRVGLWEENGVLVVHFEDDNGDDLFRYDLEYVYLPPSMIPIRGHVSGVEARGAASAEIDLGPLATGPTVLRGFDLVVRPELQIGIVEDQEIKEIGVRTPGNRIEVYYSNADADHRFDWGVDWGALTRLPVVNPDPPRIR
jgi:hypothetical protein